MSWWGASTKVKEEIGVERRVGLKGVSRPSSTGYGRADSDRAINSVNRKRAVPTRRWRIVKIKLPRGRVRTARFRPTEFVEPPESARLCPPYENSAQEPCCTSIFRPHPLQVGKRLCRQIERLRFAALAKDFPACGVEVKKDFALRRIADEAACPADGGKP